MRQSKKPKDRDKEPLGMANIQAIRGMKDILPEKIGLWQQLEQALRQLMAEYGYQEIRMPILEKTDLFKRSIGEVTDIVEKEMYTFTDRDKDSLTLRPEGTAQCVRAGLENGLLHNQTPKLWYYGPMFRHERPQKDRYRQFYQLGVESFGVATPDVDAEQIFMMERLWHKLGIRSHVVLQINSLGTSACRQRYREALVDYFLTHQNQLDEDSQNRLQTNPLRILDSKNPAMKDLVQHAPKMMDYLSDEAKAHFNRLLALLDIKGLKYEVNPTLVRGLDYYTHTVYEWVTESLGAQGTICGGGRFDGLVELIGGKATPAVGFAMGVERVISLLEQTNATSAQELDAYLIVAGEQAENLGVAFAETLRDALPGFRLMTHCGGGSMKSQFKKADKSGARVALILSEQEVQDKTITVKFLREERPQQTVGWSEVKQLLMAQN